MMENEIYAIEEKVWSYGYEEEEAAFYGGYTEERNSYREEMWDTILLYN